MNKAAYLAFVLAVTPALHNLRAADAPATATPVPAVAEPLSPVGKWSWFTGPDLTFDARGAVTGAHRPAVWFWTDEDKHELQIVWGGPVPGLDKVTLAANGKHLEGSNNDGTPVSGDRISEASAPTGAASPVGTWNWFYGPDLTFHADGTITGVGRTARWTWIDAAQRQLRIDFEGEWSAYHDTLTLSADGSRLQGTNNVGAAVTGDRIAPAQPASASSPAPAAPPSATTVNPAGT